MAGKAASPVGHTSPVIYATVSPISEIQPADAGAALDAVDAWLRRISEGYLTLERVKNVANLVPIVSNLLAAIDVVLDVCDIANAETAPGSFEWLNLGIDLIGVVPIPGTGPFRVAARPLLHLARGSAVHLGKDAAKGGVQLFSDAVIEAMVTHLNAHFMGEIETFLQTLQQAIQDWLTAAADFSQTLINTLAQVIEGAADPTRSRMLHSEHNQRAASAGLASAEAGFAAYDPQVTARGFFQYLSQGATVFVKNAGKQAAELAGPLSPNVVAGLRDTAANLRKQAPVVRQQVLALKGKDVGQLTWLVQALQMSVVMWRRRKHSAGAVVGVKAQGGSVYRAIRPKGALERIRRRKRAQGNGPGCPKICEVGSVSGSKPSISYSLGFERFSHEDFVIGGALPIVWERTYHSGLVAYDDSDLGARWTSPFSLRIDEAADGTLRYHDAMGRSIDYPTLEVGALHEDLSERLTLHRESADSIVITRTQGLTEAYERRGAHFHLAFLQARSGASIVLDYDAQNRLKRLGFPEGVLGFRHDDAGRISEVLQFDRNGDRVGTDALARYTYDTNGDLIAAFDRYGNRRDYTYRNHLVTRYTDRTGRGMTFEWEGDQASDRCVREYADDGSDDIRLRWHDELRMTEVTDADGNRTLYWYDSEGYVFRVQHADGKEEWLYWDKNHWLEQRIFADGSIERYEYDARGNRTLIYGRTADETRMRYDDIDQMVERIDPVGGRWLREYDDAGNVVLEMDPLGRETRYHYDDAGRATQIVDAKGGIKKLAYDAFGNLTRYTDCSSKTTHWVYDPDGRLLEIRDAAGGQTEYKYGSNGQLAFVATPAGVERVQYDAEARLLEHVDGLARITRYDYDAAGRIRQRRDALGNTLSYAYDRQGQLSGLIDPNGARYCFTYDAMGRLLEEIGFDGLVTQYRYDAGNGRLKEIEEAGRVIPFTTDAADRVTARGDVKYAYDQASRLIDARNAFSAVSLFYDAVGNLEREHHAYNVFGTKRSYVWHHEYDALDHRIASIRPDGHRVDWLRYDAGHVHGMLIDGAEHVSIERDDVHREISRTLANKITQTNRYDEAGRLQQQSLTRGGMPSAFAVRAYRYDRAGRLTQIQDSRHGDIAYRYDPIGRLLEASGPLERERFAFDPASNIADVPKPSRGKGGNSLADAYAHRDLSGDRGRGREDSAFGGEIPKVLGNLLKSYAGTHFTYDAHGNLAMKTSPRGRQRYQWDWLDRLVHVDVEASGRRHQARYCYDAFNRRIAKEVDGEATVFGWDGDKLAFETNAVQSTHYLYEADSFVPLAQYRGAAVEGIATPVWQADDRHVPEKDPLMQPSWKRGDVPVYYYQCDQIGTPQYLSDPAGDIAVEMSYKAWGEAREVISEAAKATGITNPLRFQGQYYDAETGLHYNRHRYYDPQLGRYHSKDPIGLIGGSNAYCYGPNPVEWVDPHGLAKVSPGAGRKPVSSKLNQNSDCE